MRSVPVVLVPLVWVGSAALAQLPAPAPVSQAAAGIAPHQPAGASTPVKAARRARNGGARRVAEAAARPAPPVRISWEDALSTCLVQWEPATHMTKRRWERAFHRVADRLRDA